MIVAFDIDDTITRHPEFFAFLSNKLKDGGHTVIIITFRENRPTTEALLEKLGVAYDKLVTSSLEAHMEHGVDEWKAAVCQELKADVFFEDDPHVVKHVDDSTICMIPIDKKRHDLESMTEPLFGF
jgi:predicted glycosyltransferase